MLEIRLQEGSPFLIRPGNDGGLIVELPQSAVEAALLRAGTSYPVLTQSKRERIWAGIAWYGPVDGELHIVGAWFGSSGLMGRVDRAPSMCGVVLGDELLEGFAPEDLPQDRWCKVCATKWAARVGGEVRIQTPETAEGSAA